jgi:hypothetical protein
MLLWAWTSGGKRMLMLMMMLGSWQSSTSIKEHFKIHKNNLEAGAAAAAWQHGHAMLLVSSRVIGPLRCGIANTNTNKAIGNPRNAFTPRHLAMILFLVMAAGFGFWCRCPGTLLRGHAHGAWCMQCTRTQQKHSHNYCSRLVNSKGKIAAPKQKQNGVPWDCNMHNTNRPRCCCLNSS